MKIKDELVLHGMTRASVDEIECNTIGTFQTSNSNTHIYYIVQWTGNAYTLQEIYTCHAFDPPVIILEVEIVFLIGVMNLAGKTISTSRIITGGSNAWHVYFPCRIYALTFH